MYKLRSRTLKVFFSMLLVGSIVIGGIFSVSMPVSAATPIKIMCVGDSCTEGMGGGGGGSYRTVLYKLYTDAGLSIDYVGSKKAGPSSLPDRDHEGYSGWTIPQIAGIIDNRISTYKPDVILLWIGGNDVFQKGVNPDGLRNLIDQIFKDKPDVTLFVADYYPWPDGILAHNKLVPGIVQEKATGNRKLYFVKCSEINWNKGSDLSGDGIHLTEGGYTKIANIWYKYTIDKLKGGNPTPTNTSTNTPTPTNTPTFTPTNTPTPTNTSIKVPEDINRDRAVNMKDVVILSRHFNTTSNDSNYDITCDLNNDGAINMKDVNLIAKKFNYAY